jgi:multidrug efflux pump subunit AcrA (membrane-fusion protein)
MKPRSKLRQRGVSLMGLIIGLAIVGMLAVLALKIVPTVSEYMAIKKAIVLAKAGGSSPAQVRSIFDRQAEVGYIESITGKDLDVVKEGDVFEVSFAYQRKIPLVGPASLVLDYEGTTSTAPPAKKPASK